LSCGDDQPLAGVVVTTIGVGAFADTAGGGEDAATAAKMTRNSLGAPPQLESEELKKTAMLKISHKHM
jgi:hypothetical protein